MSGPFPFLCLGEQELSCLFRLFFCFGRQSSESESDAEPESEEDVVDPFPLEGKYKDDADRLRYGNFLYLQIQMFT